MDKVLNFFLSIKNDNTHVFNFTKIFDKARSSLHVILPTDEVYPTESKPLTGRPS